MLARGSAPCAPSRAACSRRRRCTATAHAAPPSDDAAALPVVDLTPLSGGNATARAVAASALRRALHLHGFAYVRGAGVPSAPCCDAALSAATAFFALPDAEKLSLHYGRSPAFRGYAQLGAENTAGAPDHREQLEIGEEQAAPPPGTLPPFLRLRGPNQWPKPGACDALRPALEALADQLCGLSETLLAALGESLGDAAGGELRAALGAAPDWTLKAARYPPRDGPDGTCFSCIACLVVSDARCMQLVLGLARTATAGC
jgi:isopenicillin N synthase-like dioxygenase